MPSDVFHPGRLCRGCKNEIVKGQDVTLIRDKISKGLHHFHLKCAPTREQQPDVRRHYGISLLPLKFKITQRGMRCR